MQRGHGHDQQPQQWSYSYPQHQLPDIAPSTKERKACHMMSYIFWCQADTQDDMCPFFRLETTRYIRNLPLQLCHAPGKMQDTHRTAINKAAIHLYRCLADENLIKVDCVKNLKVFSTSLSGDL